MEVATGSGGMMQWFGAIARRVLMTGRPPAAATPSQPERRRYCVGVVTRRQRGKRFKGSYGNARPKNEKKIERIKDKVEVPRSTPWPLPFQLI